MTFRFPDESVGSSDTTVKWKIEVDNTLSPFNRREIGSNIKKIY